MIEDDAYGLFFGIAVGMLAELFVLSLAGAAAFVWIAIGATQ
jgi:hypothetical protein